MRPLTNDTNRYIWVSICVGFYQLQTIESLTKTCLSKNQDRGDWILDSFSHLCFLWTGLMLRLYVAASPQQS